MGISTLYGRTHCMEAELDSEWLTLPVLIYYTIDAGDGDAVPQTVTLEKVTAQIAGAESPLDVTAMVNTDYIMDLVADEVSGADLHAGDYA
jgi:hypothetical protein